MKDYFIETNRALAAANFLLDTLEHHGVTDVTNLKLQKMLYFAFGIHIVLFEEKLFEEDILAWRLGPVVKSVYKEFKNHKGDKIDTRASVFDENTLAIEPVRYDFFTENEQKSLTIACVIYGRKKAWNLVDITHADNSAWSKAFNRNKDTIDMIDINDIKADFEKHIDEIADFVFGN